MHMCETHNVWVGGLVCCACKVLSNENVLFGIGTLAWHGVILFQDRDER